LRSAINGSDDRFECLWRQFCVGVEEQQDIAAAGRGSCIHLPGATTCRNQDMVG
jgi:hypothetical protein